MLNLPKTSPHTVCKIHLGTGFEAMDSPPDLSLLSDEHLSGLKIAVKEEHEKRQAERWEIAKEAGVPIQFNDFSDETEDKEPRSIRHHRRRN